MRERFKNKVVVVTGSSAGIGRATALAFAKEGARLGLISRNQSRLQTLKTEIEKMGSIAEIFPIDVADAIAVENAADQIQKQMGDIDIWVNNAMVSVFSPVKQMRPEEYKRVTEVTYLGVVYGTLAALKRMLPGDRGTIVQVGSALAYRGIPLQSAYCAAKHAIQGFHDSLLTELIHDKSKVRVTMVQLSAHNTPQFDWVKSRLTNKAQPVPPIFQPEVAAHAILHAAEKTPREFISGFPSMKAIWGNKFFSSYADHVLGRIGYKEQQTNEPQNYPAENNLFQSVDGNFGAHGRFNQSAKKHDWFYWISAHLNFIFIFIILVLATILLMKFI